MIVATMFKFMLALIVAIEARPPSVLTCRQHGICNEGEGTPDFICADRNLICCSGPGPYSFQVLVAREGFRCCEGTGKTYNYQDEICVDGTIRSRDPVEENCGDYSVYNVTSQVCCDNKKVYDKIPGGECCIDEYLTDPSVQSCCGGDKYKISEQTCCLQTHNDPSRRKYLLSDISYGKCCSDVAYDPRTKSCAERDGGLRVVDEAEDNMVKCGSGTNGQYYDPETHACCYRARPEVYDLNAQLCVKGRIYDKTDPNQNDVCLYESNGRTLAIPFTRDEKTVCREGGVINLGFQESICGSKIYNTSTDLCCAFKKYPDLKMSGHVCCDSGTNHYNPEKGICCLNKVISDKGSYNSGTRCCHNNPYNTALGQYCDRGTVVNRECPVYNDRCNVTVDKIKDIRSKIYVYVATVSKSKKPSKSKKLADFRQWEITDIKGFKSKKGKLSLAAIKGKSTATLLAKKCDCPEQLEIGQRYVFITTSSIRKRKLTMKTTKSRSDYAISVAKSLEIGILFKGIIE